MPHEVDAVSTLAIVALVALLLLGSSYIIGPFVVWRVQAQRARAHFPPHDWREAVFGCGPGMLALDRRPRAVVTWAGSRMKLITAT